MESTYHLLNENHSTPTLSWGSDGELLLGSSSLQLLQTSEDVAVIWNRKLPKPVKVADFSPDASLIASTGFHDALVKIWRRQSFGSDDTRFDFSYLPHPATIVGIHWRLTQHEEHTPSHVLYSICADNKIRIWAAIDPHGLQALQQWGEIDMLESIQPRIQPVAQPSDRYALMIDNRDFNHAVQQMLRAPQGVREEQHAIDYLSDVAKRNPDLCVVLDAAGHMSAWGLENVGCKARVTTNVFNVAHIEDLRLPFSRSRESNQKRVQFLSFCDPGSNTGLNILVHHFDGRLQWLEAELSILFDPSPRTNRVHIRALWTGHDSAIKKIVRSSTGRALVSRTNDNDSLVWKQQQGNQGVALHRASSLTCHNHIHRTCLLREGDYIVNLHHESISLWDARSSEAAILASREYTVVGKPLCLILLPEPDRSSRSVHLATISSTMQGVVWEVVLPLRPEQVTAGEQSLSPTINQFCKFEIGLQDNLAFVLPVDPAGSAPLTSEFFDAFSKDVAVSYTHRGVLRTWTAALDLEKSCINWLVTSTVETSILEPSLASTSSIRKSAVVDSSTTGLTIWDMSSGQLEHDACYEPQDQVQDLDWTSTPDNQSILAVGFPHKVVLLAQMRFDYLSTGPAWAPIRQIQIKESTPHPIGDSTWLGNGNLVIGAGNQLFVYDKEVKSSDDMITDLSIPVHEHRAMDLFKLVTFLNGPLPVFHPQFLGQCILAGKAQLVQRIILGLHKALKYFSAGDDLDNFVSLSVEDFYIESPVCTHDSSLWTR